LCGCEELELRRLAGAGQVPGFGVLPADVGGVVEVEQETFAAIEEAEAEDVVPEEGEDGDCDYVGEEGDEVAA
jgi:hypothetical protein